MLEFPADADAPLYCSYESLITDPEARVREILSFLSDGPLNDEAVTRVLEEMPISPRNNLAAFEFFDPGFFRELEEAACERLERLKLPSFTDEI